MNGRGLASYVLVVLRSELASWPGAIARAGGRLRRGAAYYLFVLQTEFRLWRSSYRLFVLRYELRAGAGSGARLVRRVPRVLAATVFGLLAGSVHAIRAGAGAPVHASHVLANGTRSQLERRAEARAAVRAARGARRALARAAEVEVIAPAQGGRLPRPRAVALAGALLAAVAVPGYSLVAGLVERSSEEKAEGAAANPAAPAVAMVSPADAAVPAVPGLPAVPAVPALPAVPAVPLLPVPAPVADGSALAGSPDPNDPVGAAAAVGGSDIAAAPASAGPLPGGSAAATTMPPGWSLLIPSARARASAPAPVPTQRHVHKRERTAAYKAVHKAVHRSVEEIARQRELNADPGK